MREFETAPGRCARRCDGIAPLLGETGPVGMIEGSGNIIVSRACFEELAKPCSIRRLRSRRRGSRFLRTPAPPGPPFRLGEGCGRACLGSHEPRQSRLGAQARLSRRKFRHARVPEAPAQLGRRRAREAPRSSARLLLFPFLFVILGLASNRAVDALRRLFRAAGKIAGDRRPNLQRIRRDPWRMKP